ncbi:MAG: GDSL-type esterase/lipase family protein [Bacillus sp. (in: Bacteria)]|nr:GDSL-type esterase/lipase family protein [Bacillus sp. (in: firmicutes)]
MVKQKRSRQALLVMVSLLLLFSLVAPSAVAAKNVKHDTLQFVALGDSLAAGYTPVPGGSFQLLDGYPEYLQARLEQSNYTTELTNFAVPGYTTWSVLSQLNNATIVAEVQQADILTLNIGANDALPLLFLGLPDSWIQPVINTALANTRTILNTIQSVNDNDVQIYVMGYYNPVLLYDQPDSFKNRFDRVATQFNNSLEQMATEMDNVHFVATASLVEKNADTYLTDFDIHLTQAGYEGVAKEFWKSLTRTKGWRQR